MASKTLPETISELLLQRIMRFLCQREAAEGRQEPGFALFSEQGLVLVIVIGHPIINYYIINYYLDLTSHLILK